MMRNYFGRYKGFYIERDSHFITVVPFQEVITYGNQPNPKLQILKDSVVKELNKEQTKRIKQDLKPLTIAEVKKIIDEVIIKVGSSK